MSGIIWLASYPKSGNTWLRAFLANYLARADKPIAINDLPKHILGDNLRQHYLQFSGLKDESLDAAAIARLRPKVHQWMAASRGHDVFVKTHNAIALADGVPLITPAATAGAIYVLRNPFDVALSFANHYQITLARAVESLCESDYRLPEQSGILEQYLGDWGQHVKSWTTAQGMTRLVLRYEDLHAKPLKAFGEVVRFLGLPKEMDRLKRAVRFSSFNELKQQEGKTQFIEARPDGKAPFFRSGRSGGWRQAMEAPERDRLVERFGDLLREQGYLAGDGRITV
ncbi:MAG: sulfotransferase domain-containing protein [Rhodospirillales bacterium]